MVQIILDFTNNSSKSVNKLYIPHGSDNTGALILDGINQVNFISHMVQIIQKIRLEPDVLPDFFISHMVQIILIFISFTHRCAMVFISHMVQIIL